MPLTEHRFHPTRKWRFDYAWEGHRVALEVEGGVWVGGRHTSGAGFVKDMEKYNEAACLGWRIIRCQPRELCSSKTVDNIKRAMQWQ
jgi:very-short-patch-repair endonuclease